MIVVGVGETEREYIGVMLPGEDGAVVFPRRLVVEVNDATPISYHHYRIILMFPSFI